MALLICSTSPSAGCVPLSPSYRPVSMPQRNVLSDHHERLGLLRADINDLECAGEITRRTVVKCGQNNDRHITDFIDRVEKLEEARK